MFRTLLILSLAITSLHAQIVAPTGSGAGVGMNIADHLLIAESRKFGNVAAAEIIDGTPYLKDDFQVGSISTTKGTYTAVSMRYNVNGNHVEFKDKDVTYILDPTASVKKVSLPDVQLVVYNYTLKGKSAPGFYVLLDSGKLILLAKKNVMLHPRTTPQAR